jgi:pimeloyl-ACP methyl ester carboxylesterase
MRKITVGGMVSIDGVMRAPGGHLHAKPKWSQLMRQLKAVAGGVMAAAIAVTLVSVGAPSGERGYAFAADTKEARRVTPTKTGYVNVSGARFYYQVYGDLSSTKKPLLVLHGSFMSSDAMAPLIEGFAGTRPVIAFDARGHGRTGELPGPFTYAQMATDAAGVLDALNVPTADLLGYSMGGVTAVIMAVRFPDKVGKQVIVSGVSRRDGWYPEVLQVMAQITPEAFAGSPLEAEYKRLSPTPDAFPALVRDIRNQEAENYDQPDEAIRTIKGKTMIVVGDSDGVKLDHALKLFRLRGGGDSKEAAPAFLTEAPSARLAILPATAHVGIMASGPLIAELVVPFLDDTKPIVAPGFFKESP